MSISTDASEMLRISGRKSPEKSNFRQTCNLLSQYLKGKGSLGDLSLGIPCRPEGKAQTETLCPTTMNLLPRLESSGEVPERNVMDLFPQHADFGISAATTEDARKRSDERPTKVDRAPLTIFYGGKVVVFNDIPADKARDLMLMVTKGTVPNPSAASVAAGVERGNRSQQPSTPSAPTAACNPPAQDPFSRPNQANVSDLPIARKVSLQRFLEKRKGRAAAVAPYPTSKDSPAPAKPTESKRWLGLAPET